MRSPHAASAAAKLAILLALAALPQISVSEAATKCPSGQILRVRLGICVPKAQNLAILSKHGAPKARPEEDAFVPASPRKPARNEAISSDTPDEAVEVAQRDTSPADEAAAVRPAPQAEPPSSPFGSLFVGAFRSTLSAGLSAFR